MTAVEIVIEQTAVPHQGLSVVTARSSDPHLLRPYVLFVKNGARGTVTEFGSYSCEASAAHAHEAMVRRLMADAEQTGSNAV